ncbi:flagellar filament capping protein FliD [Ferribacterium limneticum]|uniref:flagellar filament capping protein FliD n=1 Tax=Ferribacterium limneticum TaxID=76259 RepID=UPI001CFAF273|nr:flagellar filament capping protein FliD [Ferribacterium limneticum]UCV19772.1 flagellar filament capping protein FliD [Ferribacterium limneticum]
MATTSSLGVGTGIDLQSMLTKIMAAERAPIDALNTKIAAANTKISLYGTLKSKLDALQSAADTLRFPSRLAAISATSSDAGVVGSSATYSASIGSYSAEVTQLASAQKSFSVAYTTGSTFGQGTLNFTVGGVAATPIAMNDQASYTLEEVGARINNAKVGVTASVITDSSGNQRMVLTGEKSGDANSFTLASTLAPSGGQSSLASFDTATVGLMRTSAQNGKMKLDGIEISSSTNSFTTGVTGLTLSAVKLGTANISVQNDSAKITTAVQAFVDSYNAVVSLVKSNTGYDTTTKKSQALSGDSTVRSVLGNLGSARSSTPATLSSATFKTLSELGVSIQQSGLLALDSSKLSKATSTSATEVIKTLGAYGQTFSTAVTEMQNTGGLVTTRINSLNSSVSRFKESQVSLEHRVSLIEKRYQAQFTALDKYVSAMNVTSSALTQQLAALTTNSS